MGNETLKTLKMYFWTLISVVVLAVSIEIVTSQPSSCGHLFEWNFDETSKIKSGSIRFLLEEKFNVDDLELEVVFAFLEFPIFVRKFFWFHVKR